jgi:hypothetical protein
MVFRGLPRACWEFFLFLNAPGVDSCFYDKGREAGAAMGWSPLHTLSMEANKYCPAICYCSLLSSFYRSLGSTLSRDRV